jgi:PBP1b-binding outer membrane lipoprotein LpoB
MKFGKLGVIGLMMTGWMIAMAGTSCSPSPPAPSAADAPAPKPAPSAAAAPAPKTYAEAVKQIQDRMKSIDTAIKAGKLNDIDPEAKVIITLSQSLGELALADKSGVAKDKVKEVNQAAKDLAEMTDKCHDAADEGKADETKGHYASMVKLVKIISDSYKG